MSPSDLESQMGEKSVIKECFQQVHMRCPTLEEMEMEDILRSQKDVFETEHQVVLSEEVYSEVASLSHCEAPGLP